MGRFPVNSLSGGAQIEDGRLLLPTDSAALIAATHKTCNSSKPGPKSRPCRPTRRTTG